MPPGGGDNMSRNGVNIAEIKSVYPSIKTIVTNKTGSISMIGSQYMQQIALQHPTCIPSLEGHPVDSLCAIPHFVSIGVKGYSPSSITIYKGDSVTWSNEYPSGSPPVRVSSDTGAFDSGDVQPGHSFGHTFEKQGTYKYSDKHHPSKGEIIVT